jgi:hypothetical protein
MTAARKMAGKNIHGDWEMLKYAIVFGGIYLLCIVISVAASSLLNFDLPSSMGIIILIAALTAPVQSFVKDHLRVFTTGERALFAAWIGLAVVVLNLCLGLAFLYGVDALLGGTNPIKVMLAQAARSGISAPVAFLGMAAISFAVSWIVTFFFAGFYARQSLKRLGAS